MKVGVFGVTIYGNLGGQAMLEACIQNLPPKVNIILFSISGKKDLEIQKLLHPRFSNVHVVPVTPIKLLLFYLPISLLIDVFPLLKFLKKPLLFFNFFKELSSLSIAIDLSGICFVDNRGLALLAYNVACVLPSRAFNISTYKLSQALGPFNQKLNFLIAKYSLSKINKIVARGKITYENLKVLFPLDFNERVLCLPDVAFSLSTPNPLIENATKQLEPVLKNKKLVIISPSRVLETVFKKANRSLSEELSALIKNLIQNNFDVVLLAHSQGIGKSKNNDLDIIEDIYRKCNSEKLHVISDSHDNLQLRALISCANVFLGCRFHSIVAALSMGVPTIILGWSHKYKEMLDAFEVQLPCYSEKEFSAINAFSDILELHKNNEQYRNSIIDSYKKIKPLSKLNFELLEEGV